MKFVEQIEAGHVGQAQIEHDAIESAHPPAIASASPPVATAFSSISS